MKFRKLKAALLTGVMALSLGASALAADTATDKTLKVNGTVKVPVINMQMPTNAAIVLNPYKLKVTIDKTKDIEDQIAAVPMSIVNLSDCPIQVAVKASAKAAGNAVLVNASKNATTPPATTAGKNNVHIAVAAVIGNAAISQTDAATKLYTWDATGKAYKAVTDGALTVLSDTDADVKTASEADFSYATPVAAALNNTLAAGTGTKAADAHGYFNFTFCGDVTSASPWAEKDTVTPTLTFKFTPVDTMPTT